MSREVGHGLPVGWVFPADVDGNTDLWDSCMAVTVSFPASKYRVRVDRS